MMGEETCELYRAMLKYIPSLSETVIVPDRIQNRHEKGFYENPNN